MNPDRKNRQSNRRAFLESAAAGVLGASAIVPALAQRPGPIEGQTREQLRRDMLAGIEEDVKHDLEVRAKAVEELPEPKNIRPAACSTHVSRCTTKRRCPKRCGC